MDEFWADLTRRLRRARCRRARRARLHLPAVRRHEPRLPQRPRAARARCAERGGDAEHLHEAYIRHINEALAGRPEGMAVTTHMCRGNFRSSWVAEGGYDFVAEALFNELDVDGFFLEYDDARSGGFEPLRFVPKGKLVVLGLVTTKRGELETKDELKRRIEEASQYVDLDQLCLSPQCGFSSTVEGNALTRRAAGRQAAADRRDRRGGLGLTSAEGVSRSSSRRPVASRRETGAVWKTRSQYGALIPKPRVSSWKWWRRCSSRRRRPIRLRGMRWCRYQCIVSYTT